MFKRFKLGQEPPPKPERPDVDNGFITLPPDPRFRVLSESRLSLRDAADLAGVKRKTMLRWAAEGVCGVRLETVGFEGDGPADKITSLEAMVRFAETALGAEPERRDKSRFNKQLRH